MKLYFKVINEEHSRRVQEELFNLGYHWSANEPKEVKTECK